MQMKEYAKAIVGALLAGLAALATGLADGSMTPVEWVLMASATIAAGGIVFGVPNASPEEAPEHRALD